MGNQKTRASGIFISLILVILGILGLLQGGGAISSPDTIDPSVSQSSSIPEIEIANTSIQINMDQGIFVSDSIIIINPKSEPIENFTIYMNGLVASLSIESNLSVIAKVTQGNKNSSIYLEIQTSSWSAGFIRLTYEIRDVVILLTESYLFSYGLPFKANKIGFVDVALPPNAQIGSKFIGGQVTPLISPLPTSNYSDGVRTHFRWEPGDVIQSQPIVIEFQIVEATTEETNPTLYYVVFFFLGLVTGVLLSILSYWGYRWYQSKETKSSDAIARTSEPTPELTTTVQQSKDVQFVNLTDQERKIIYALMDLDRRASQETLRKHLGWGKSKLSTYIKRLEAKNLVQQTEVGRKKFVHLVGDVEL